MSKSWRIKKILSGSYFCPDWHQWCCYISRYRIVRFSKGTVSGRIWKKSFLFALWNTTEFFRICFSFRTVSLSISCWIVYLDVCASKIFWRDEQIRWQVFLSLCSAPRSACQFLSARILFLSYNRWFSFDKCWEPTPRLFFMELLQRNRIFSTMNFRTAVFQRYSGSFYFILLRKSVCLLWLLLLFPEYQTEPAHTV